MRRNPVLTSLIVLAIAGGIGVSITMLTIYHVMDSNPIPQKSDQLYRVLVDSWDPLRPFNSDDPSRAPIQMTWRDATGLLALKGGIRQVAMFESLVIIQPEDEEMLPFEAATRVTNADFFPMFDVPFQYGGGWTSSADDSEEPVTVISRQLNERLFGGSNSVGNRIRINDTYFTITGVRDTWEPMPRFFDVVNNPFQDVADVFVPLALTPSMKWNSAGSDWGWKAEDINSWEDWLNSESCWLQYWTELDGSSNATESYLDHLDSYAKEQKKLGRFERPLNNQIYPVMPWLAYNEVVMQEVRVLVGLGFLFFVVCLLSSISLLLTKFNSRRAELSLRRALGANRQQIMAQNLIEVSLIGAAGGLLGVGLTFLNLTAIQSSITRVPPALFNMDWSMIGVAMVISIVAAITAGLYPAWQSCRVTPAAELKVN